MKELNTKLKNELMNLFRDHTSFRRVERKLYGHDIAAIPGLIKPFIGSTVPGAVVQPQSEAELSTLVRWTRVKERG